MTEQDAYRAAGQAVAALLHGAPIDHVDISGIVLRWPEVRDALSRNGILAEIAVGLAGIAAQDRYGFGGPITSTDVVVSWSFTPSQVDDFAIAREMARALDPLDFDDVFFRVWNQAIDLVANAAAWHAIQRVAAAVYRERCTAADVSALCQSVCLHRGDPERHRAGAEQRPADGGAAIAGWRLRRR